MMAMSIFGMWPQAWTTLYMDGTLARSIVENLSTGKGQLISKWPFGFIVKNTNEIISGFLP